MTRTGDDPLGGATKEKTTMAKKQIQQFSNENKLGRMFGLGQNPPPGWQQPQGLGQSVTHALAAQTLQCGFTQVPVIEYVTWTVELPMLDASINATFGDEIDVLTNPKSVTGITSVDSSFAINGLLQVDMVVVGFGVHAFAEPESGTVMGNVVSAVPVAGSVPVSPDAYTLNDVNNGALGLGSATITPALLEWGAPAWNAMWHLLNGYQFQWIVQQRFALIQELACDVAYFGPYAEGIASGTSQEAAQRFARRVNDQYTSLGFTGAFLPINAQRIGSVTSGVTAGSVGVPLPTGLSGKNIGVFHPTRAYDELNVTWGGLRGTGGAACCTPFRKLAKPVLLEKGIPINMKLVAQDAYHQSIMQQYLSIDDYSKGGGLSDIMTLAAASGGNTIANTSTTAPFLELTLDATPVAVSQQVLTDRSLLKGGAFKLAILVKGFEVWGQWRDYILSQLIPQGTVATPSGMGAAGTLAGR